MPRPQDARTNTTAVEAEALHGKRFLRHGRLLAAVTRLVNMTPDKCVLLQAFRKSTRWRKYGEIFICFETNK